MLDFISITETKIDSSFTNQQFFVQGYHLHRQDSTDKSGGILAYIRSDIAHRRRPDLEIPTHDIQTMVIECDIGKEKWMIITLYKLPRIKNEHLVEHLDNLYNIVLNETKDVICMGDINVNMLKQNPITQNILQIYDITNVIKDPTCFKSATGTLLDPVFVSNKNRILSHFNVTCGFSDWHNMVGCVTRLHMPRQNPQVIKYRTYKIFNNDDFTKEVQCIPFHVCEIFDDIDDQSWAYNHLVCDVLDEYAPFKKKIVKKNQVPYMNSKLRKEMFHRNKLKNRYFKNRNNINWDMYRRQRNKVTKLKRMSVRNYFEDRCKYDVNGKIFWKTIKPFMSDKGLTNNSVILKEGPNIVTDSNELADIFNGYFSTIANEIGQPDYIDHDDTVESIIQRHINHPSIVEIKAHNNCENIFKFKPVTPDQVLKQMSTVNIRKATGHDNVPPKIIKLCAPELAPYFTTFLNRCIDQGKFPNDMKKAEIVERLTISRHVTLCYQLSTLVCLVLFCCCLLHCDKIHLSPVCETMRCKVFYTKQRKHSYLFVT